MDREGLGIIMGLKLYNKNAKKHPDKQLKLIAKSLKNFGWKQPIVVDKNDVIIVGHGRWMAYEKYPEGIKEPWIIKADDLNEKQVKAYRLADNKLNESDWEMDLVIEELKELDEELVGLTGFDKDLLIEPDEKDDMIPEDCPPVARLGDLWQLGEHRVMCGDSTKVEDVKKLMDGEIGKMMFTSPPYNIGGDMYESYKDNLKSREYIDFNLKVFELWNNFLKGITFWNISYNKNSKTEFIEILYEITKTIKGTQFLDLVVWDKGHGMPVTSRDAMTRTYEDIFVFNNDEELYKDTEMIAVYKNHSNAYYIKKKDKGLGNYWKIGTNKTQLDNHKACYPVMLVLKAIMIGSEENEIIIEPFLGSGTNIIACEKTNRICYGMELDPKYIDVIIKRWEDYTGNKAIKV